MCSEEKAKRELLMGLISPFLHMLSLIFWHNDAEQSQNTDHVCCQQSEESGVNMLISHHSLSVGHGPLLGALRAGSHLPRGTMHLLLVEGILAVVHHGAGLTDI